MAGLCAPLSALRRCPRGHLRMTRGRCGSLLLHRDGLAPSTPCRSPGALRFAPKNGHRATSAACPFRAKADVGVTAVRPGAAEQQKYRKVLRLTFTSAFAARCCLMIGHHRLAVLYLRNNQPRNRLTI